TPVSAQDRVDLYKPDGSREGWATVDKSGRVDLYDTRPTNRLRPHARRPPGVIRHSGASPEHDHSTRATWRRSPTLTLLVDGLHPDGLESPRPTHLPRWRLMQRRSFQAGLMSVVGMPRAAGAQPAGKLYRVGFLAGDRLRRSSNFADAYG